MWLANQTLFSNVAERDLEFGISVKHLLVAKYQYADDETFVLQRTPGHIILVYVGLEMVVQYGL